MGLVVAFRYIVGKNNKEKQYPWEWAPVRTNLKPEERRGIHVLATWYTYNENGSLEPLNMDKKHFFLDIEDYIATTHSIKCSPLRNAKIDADSINLCYFNQQLLSLMGWYYKIMFDFQVYT